MRGWVRVSFLGWLFLIVASTYSGIGATQDRSNLSGRRCFDVTRLSWGDVSPVPNSDEVLISVLGSIYAVDPSGGGREILSSDDGWHSAPQASPDGRRIAFLSDLDGGTRNLWIMNLDGSGVRQISKLPYDIASFSWGPHGTIFVSFSNREEQGILVYSFRSGQLLKSRMDIGLDDRAIRDIHFSVSDGSIYFTLVDSGRRPNTRYTTRIMRMTSIDADPDPVSEIDEDVFAPVTSPDGRWLAFGVHNEGRTSLRLKPITASDTREIISFPLSDQSISTAGVAGSRAPQGLIPHYSFSADSRSLVVTADGRPTIINMEDGSRTNIDFRISRCVDVRTIAPLHSVGPQKALQLTDLDISWNGETAVFSALGYIWSVELRTKQLKRITTDEEFAYDPAISDDGTMIAYVSWNDHSGASIRTRSILTDEFRELESGDQLASPRWCRGGQCLYYVRSSQVPCSIAPDIPAARECTEKGLSSFVDRAEVIEWSDQTGASRAVVETWSPARFRNQTIVTGLDSEGISLFLFTPALGPDGRFVKSVSVANTRTGEIRPAMLFSESVGSDVEVASLSANSTYLSMIARDGLWLTNLQSTSNKTPVFNSFDDLQAERVGPYPRGVSWTSDGELLWFAGSRLFRWTQRTSHTEELWNACLPIERPSPDGFVAFTNAKIITMGERGNIHNGTILVSSGRIAAIGEVEDVTIPRGASVIDLAGFTVMPGIVDTHAHAHFSPSKTPQGYYYQQNLSYLGYLTWGVTTIFDPQASTNDVFSQAELVAAGRMLGPRVYSTGEAIFGFDTNRPNWATTVSDLDIAVERRVSAGAIMIKSYLVDRRDWRQAIIRTAGRMGVGITFEGGGRFQQSLTQIADGISAFEHNFTVYPLQSDWVEYLAATGVFYTPVLVDAMVYPNGNVAFARSPILTSARYRRFASPRDWTKYSHIVSNGSVPSPVLGVGSSAASIMRSGGKVTVGSHGDQHGLGAHWDVWLLNDSGFSRYEALRSATIVGAEKLGLQNHLGSLEPGKLADLVVFEEDPLKDIRNTLSAKFVVVGGVVYDAPTLTQLYPRYRPVRKPRLVSVDHWRLYKGELPPPLNITRH